MKRTLVAAALLGGLAYACDYLSLRYRIPHNRTQFGSVQIQRYYAVRRKDRRIEYMYDEPRAQACVYALFPHLGASPCWWVERHRKQRVDLE